MKEGRAMAFEMIRTETQGAVAMIILDRPKPLNAPPGARHKSPH